MKIEKSKLQRRVCETGEKLLSEKMAVTVRINNDGIKAVKVWIDSTFEPLKV